LSEINALSSGASAGIRDDRSFFMPTSRESAVQASEPNYSDVVGILAREQIAVLVSILGARFSRGATAYYRAAWDISTVEWRLLLTLSRIESLNVSELSDAADIDKAAASRSLALLQERKLVFVEQTRSRGRAAIAKLTAEGRKLAIKLARVSREREARLFKDFTAADKELLNDLLLRLSRALDSDDWKY
jgi:DNA-binding MarR family transcriptional regulator